MDNNKAELKGVRAIKSHLVLGFWMGLGFQLLTPFV